jgi:hypothetical protein
LSQPLLKHTQDILTEAIPARSYTEGSTLNLARAALFGVPLSKVESIVELLRTYRGGKPNSLILGGPLGWSWQATLDTTHHGSLAGPANAHRHSDLANIGIDDHHARDHATRHAVGGGDQVSLDASQIGSGTFGVARGGTGLSSIAAGGILYASAADTLSRIAPTAANQVLRSTGANALQIAALVAADIPSLDASKITSGRFGMARMPDGTSGYFLKAAGAGNDPVYANHDVDTGVHGVGSNYVCQAPASGHLVRAFTKGWTAEKLLKGAGLGADPTEINVPPTIQVVRKTADETVNNSSTLQNDDHLYFAVGANEIWEFEIFLRVVMDDIATALGLRCDFSVPSEGACKIWCTNQYHWTASKNQHELVNGTYFRTSPPLANENCINYIKAVYIGGANAGNVQFQWAQIVAHASDSKVLANSILIAHKIA